ncbi:MAG: AhpC/TSA family protein [Prevotella sp.]|nr:AhpC/TSA family protein [Prevotella sp.]
MKKIFFAALMLLASVGSFAQKAVITGKIKGMKADTHVFLMNIADPTNMVPVAVGADGNYKLELDAPEPYTRFLILDDPKGGFKFYVQQGMKANIDLELIKHNEGGEETYESKVTYTGDHKDCFEFLSEGDYYSNAQNPLLMKYYGKGLNPTFGQFRGELRHQVDKLEGKLMEINNPVFRKWMKGDYEQKMNGSLGWYNELSDKADSTLIAWMETLDRNAIYNDALTYANFYRKFMTPAGEDATLYFLNHLNTLYSNKDIANQLADEYVSRVFQDAPSNIDDVYAAYRTISSAREIPANVQSLYDHYKNLVPGAKAADFDMYDANGKKVMLSKLKGKALYVDCWATWCGPCRAETPNMIKLYEHFKNDKRIQLVSISLDKKEAAWKAVVKKENLAWPQYIIKGEYESDMCKNYDIQGIPRFMMFDKNGRIVSLDAPRPSAPNIIEWIEGNLK